MEEKNEYTTGGHHRIPKEEIERLLSQVKDQSAIDKCIIDLVKERKVVYLRELQLVLEDRLKHQETRNRVNSLVEEGKLKTEFKFDRRWYYPIDEEWNNVEKIAKEKLELVKFLDSYERRCMIDDKKYMDYAEYLAEQALISAGYTVVARDTYYFNGVICIKGGPGRPSDLDFIAALPNSKGYVGIEVKNRLDYPEIDDVDAFIGLREGLKLKPLLITRQALPMMIGRIRSLGGWTIVFKRILLKPGFPKDKFDALHGLCFPVSVYTRTPDFLVKRLIEAADRLCKTMTTSHR